MHLNVIKLETSGTRPKALECMAMVLFMSHTSRSHYSEAFVNIYPLKKLLWKTFRNSQGKFYDCSLKVYQKRDPCAGVFPLFLRNFSEQFFW